MWEAVRKDRLGRGAMYGMKYSPSSKCHKDEIETLKDKSAYTYDTANESHNASGPQYNISSKLIANIARWQDKGCLEESCDSFLYTNT